MEPQEVHGTELVAAAMWQAYGSYGLKESAQDRELEERVERHVDLEGVRRGGGCPAWQQRERA